MDGLSLGDCCRRLDILPSTARTRLKCIFKKTGVHRQSALVSLLLRTIGLVRLRNEKAKVDRLSRGGLFDPEVIRVRVSPGSGHDIVHAPSGSSH